MTLSEDIQKLFVIAQYHVQDIFNLLADPETGFQNVLSLASHPSQSFCWCLVGQATVSTDKNAGILFHDKNPRIAKQPRISCCLSNYGNSEPIMQSLRESGKQCMKIFGLCCSKCDLSSKSEKRWVKPKQFNCDRRSYPAVGLKNHGELIRWLVDAGVGWRSSSFLPLWNRLSWKSLP